MKYLEQGLVQSKCSKGRLSFIKHNIPQIGGNFRKSRAKNNNAAVITIKLFQEKLVIAHTHTQFLESAGGCISILQQTVGRRKDNKVSNTYQEVL